MDSHFLQAPKIEVMLHQLEDAYVTDVRGVQLIDKSNLKKSVLLKRRLHWEGQNVLERFGQRKKVQRSQQDNKSGFDDITCPICLEVFVRSTATICGHCFCERCIFEGLLRKAQCPICRSNIKNQQFLFSQVLDNQINSLVAQSCNPTIKMEFQQRTSEHNDWNSSRKVTTIVIGDYLDVLDTEHIWCIGQIEKIMKLKNETQVLIHYEGWHKMYDEYIPTTSYRIAPKGFFTCRKDLPRYLRSDQNDAIYSYVVLQQESERAANEDLNAPRSRYHEVFDLLSIIFQRRQTQRALNHPPPQAEDVEPGEILSPPLLDTSAQFNFSTDRYIQPDGAASYYPLTDEEDVPQP